MGGDQMSTRDDRWVQGTPNWVDLSSPDVAASNDFYRALFGWDIVDTGPEMGNYGMCLVQNREVAGIGPAQPGSDGPPTWTTYVAVDDADKTCEAITEHGGRVLLAPMAVADQGRMAIAQDPTGAYFGLWQAESMIGMSIFNEPGTVVWNEQLSRDPERARAFYGAVFGYTFTPVEGALYWTITPPGAQDVVGGLGALPEGVPADVPSHWLTYFMVDSVDDTVAKAEGAGGTVVRPPFDTPFGRVGVLVDPHGAMFSVMSAPDEQQPAQA
jgi:predicted enzyme related to lactoylglutathione lyase